MAARLRPLDSIRALKMEPGGFAGKCIVRFLNGGFLYATAGAKSSLFLHFV